MNEHALKVLVEVAETLAFLTPVGPSPLPGLDRQELVVQVRFRGPRCGRVVLALGPALTEQALRNVSGEASEAAGGQIELAKELANVIAGNLMPLLYGDRMEFAIDQPEPCETLLAVGDRTVAAAGLELLEGLMAVAVEESAAGDAALAANELPEHGWLPPQFAAILAALGPGGRPLCAAQGDFVSSQLEALRDAAGDERTVRLHAALLDAYAGMVSSIGHEGVTCDLLRDQLPRLANAGLWRVRTSDAERP